MASTSYTSKLTFVIQTIYQEIIEDLIIKIVEEEEERKWVDSSDLLKCHKIHSKLNRYSDKNVIPMRLVFWIDRRNYTL